MPHFIIKSSDISGNKVIIENKDMHRHIIRVLRAKQGEELKFVDENEIVYETVLAAKGLSSFECEIKNQYKSERRIALNLYVAPGVLNSDAQTGIIQKATELGVKGIIPVITDNCSVKESVAKKKTEKWKKIAFESVQQCERPDIPEVFQCSHIPDIVGDYDKVFVFGEKNADMTFFKYAIRNRIDKNAKILVIVGPEGGFSEKEYEFFKEKEIPVLTLGKLIYRADTALVAALTSVINGVSIFND